MTDARTPLHTRTIKVDGFARADGSIDVEARLVDVKHYDLPAWSAGPLPAGSPMHDLRATMNVGTDGTIRAFEASTRAGPHASCRTGSANFRRLVGSSIGKGFVKRAAEHVGGVEGCTHLREMLQQMATVAFQSMRESRVARYASDADARPPLLDSCAAWAASGDWVKVRFPKFWTAGAREGADGTPPAVR